jgi:hypothetical protein
MPPPGAREIGTESEIINVEYVVVKTKVLNQIVAVTIWISTLIS